jgi:hypothetical protein
LAIIALPGFLLLGSSPEAAIMSSSRAYDISTSAHSEALEQYSVARWHFVANLDAGPPGPVIAERYLKSLKGARQIGGDRN